MYKTNNILSICLIWIFCHCINYSNSIFIAKGTLWCGVGNQAKNCTELGELTETDSCCRQHDMCPYKYTSKHKHHNGFKWSRLFSYTLSHCECDMKFKHCLNDGSHKKGASKIWHTYKLLQVRCFAYLPCNDTDKSMYENIWSHMKNRKTGTCFNNYKVVAFNHVDDYVKFMNTHLTEEQKLEVKTLLNDNLDKFYSPKVKNKKYINCVNNLTSYKSELVRQFSERYLFNLTTASKNSSDLLLVQADSKITTIDEDTYKSKSLSSLSRDAFIRVLSIFT